MDDTLFNPVAQYPPRPTISNFQWISGTQYITPSDLSMLIGGPNRPPSQKMIDQMRTEEREAREAKNVSRTNASRNPGQRQDENYFQYMARQMQQRTEKLSFAEDTMDRLGEASSNFADDVDKFVRDQKKKAVLGAFGAKFGF
ncbi:hypothetical protein KEM55_002668 [Ascosphaera atra]|nr:hypothetical protein KEM55_002668 [Ascosphaera atra]